MSAVTRFSARTVYFRNNFNPNSEFLNIGSTASGDGDEHEIFTSGWREGRDENPVNKEGLAR